MGWRSPALQLKARLICDNLYNQLDEEHLLKTGKVTKVYHFRSSKNRALFRWVFGVHNNRFFTLRAVTEALRMMVKEHKLKLPEVPGLKLEAWIQKEGRSLQLLLCKARRSIAVAMDNDETQVLKDHREVEGGVEIQSNIIVVQFLRSGMDRSDRLRCFVFKCTPVL